MKLEIDVAEFAAQLKAGKGIGGKDGALTPLIKQLTEMALQAELETHLSQDLERNRKNGTSPKTMKSSTGTFELDTPRDRSGSFELELVKKNQTHMSDELESKMLSLFALGNSYSQIADHIEDMYGVHFSKSAITAITDKLIPKAWGVEEKSLTEGIDTSTASGELIFHIFGALAQFERSLIKERVNAGLRAAIKRGRVGGRPRAISEEKLQLILQTLNDGKSKAEICRVYNARRSTLIDTLNRLPKRKVDI